MPLATLTVTAVILATKILNMQQMTAFESS